MNFTQIDAVKVFNKSLNDALHNFDLVEENNNNFINVSLNPIFIPVPILPPSM